ncbi:MAG TPA: LuxR C-terminal-related transcriptional regulator [Bauldia sp.]|nr:LuxR C-terminal-related transcriptional regulator [Bauldia sp.]
MQRAAWKEARACFETALAVEATADAYEGLSWACWWQDDFAPLVAAREAAFRLFRQQRDSLGAARMAMWLAADYCDFRGEAAISNGWLRRAESLLEALPMAPEHGWLRLIEADIALTLAGDVATANRAATAATAIGREVGDFDCTMMALAVRGFALVCEGDVAAGIRCLDEAAAAATGGELTRQSAPLWILCYLIYSCERVRDFDRAAQWCERMREVADRLRFLFPRGICRVHYAGVLILRGLWGEAESELVESEAMFSASRPPWIAESRVRLAELRRRQGHLDQAEEIFRQVEWHPLALLGLAELALDKGKPRDADEFCARLLRQLPESARFQRLDALELVVRSAALLGERARAAEALAEIEILSERAATLPLRAARCFSMGMEAIAAGDYERSRVSLEDAVDLFEKTGTPYEAARARLELAGVLVSQDRLQRARIDAEKARDELEKLGSRFHAGRAQALLKDIERRQGEKAAAGAGARVALTARQAEILRLIAEGKSDRDIAAALGLSEFTVHRHVSNILNRIALPSRAAAVAYAIAHKLI